MTQQEMVVFLGNPPQTKNRVQPPDDTPLKKMICNLEAPPPTKIPVKASDMSQLLPKKKSMATRFLFIPCTFQQISWICVVPRPLGHQTRAGNTTFLFNRKYLDLYLLKGYH